MASRQRVPTEDISYEDPTRDEEPLVVIEARKGFFGIDFKEIWSYRDLFLILVWRDILVRYKQTLLGASWAVLQPLATMLIFTLFFGRLAKIPSDGLPYPVFSYSAVLLWTYFSQALNVSANALIINEKLVTKVYFPRIMMPATPVLAGLLDLAIGSCLFCVLLPYFHMGLSANVWAVPIMVLIAVTSAMGAGLWLSALNLKYRDFSHLMPFIIQFWMFVSPVVYPVSLVPEKWRILFSLNPMAGAIEGFRWALLGTSGNPWPLVLTSALSAVLILLSGAIYFRRSEEYFADLI
ncbi:ABC transporter permease [Thermodesulfobacteriota bacterium]